MRRTVIACSASFVVTLMLAMPVSAQTVSVEAYDGIGDVNIFWNMVTGEPELDFPAASPFVKAGYLDMTWAKLSEADGVYTFEMQVAKALPKEGSPLVKGLRTVYWEMWIDPIPWNPVLSPTPPLFRIALSYDGSEYTAFVTDCILKETTMIDPFVSGGSLQLVFSAELLKNLEFQWWAPAIMMFWGPDSSGAGKLVDQIDYGTVSGQMYSDLPWA